MTNINLKIQQSNNQSEFESLYSYCSRLSKKNNSILYLLESYLGKKLLEDEKLAEIRDILLTVSADITKIQSNLIIESGEDNEGF